MQPRTARSVSTLSSLTVKHNIIIHDRNHVGLPLPHLLALKRPSSKPTWANHKMAEFNLIHDQPWRTHPFRGRRHPGQHRPRSKQIAHLVRVRATHDANFARSIHGSIRIRSICSPHLGERCRVTHSTPTLSSPTPRSLAAPLPWRETGWMVQPSSREPPDREHIVAWVLHPPIRVRAGRVANW